MMTEHVIPHPYMVQPPPVTQYVNEVLPKTRFIPRPNIQQVIRSFVNKEVVSPVPPRSIMVP